jgi:hypothetical protein
MSCRRLPLPVLGLLLMTALSLPDRGHAAVFCVFDLLGRQGPLYAAMKEYALEARGWGAAMEVRASIDERVAAEELKAGQCDAALLTGVRARQFNFFTGSIDSIGGLPDYPALKQVIGALARPETRPLLLQGDYEITGLLPLGAAYLFLRDRQINSVAKMAGRKMAVLDYDPAQLRMVERIGAQAVASDVTNFAGKFNNGQVDVAASPAVAYLPLELYKGVGSRGVVLKLPVAQLTFQMVTRKGRFPDAFSQHSREWFLGQFDRMIQEIRRSEDDILFFFPPPDGDAPKYTDMMREARIAMTREGLYDPKMMRLMKKVRCRQTPGHAECTDNRE